MKDNLYCRSSNLRNVYLNTVSRCWWPQLLTNDNKPNFFFFLSIVSNKWLQIECQLVRSTSIATCAPKCRYFWLRQQLTKTLFLKKRWEYVQVIYNEQLLNRCRCTAGNSHWHQIRLHVLHLHTTNSHQVMELMLGYTNLCCVKLITTLFLYIFVL